MAGLCHESTAAIGEAAKFLAAVPPVERPKPLVPAIRAMFGLSSIEVCLAIRESHLIDKGGADAEAS